MFHRFLIWPLIVGLCPFLMIYYRIFLPFLLHGLGIRKVTSYFQVFSGRTLGLSYAPLKFSKEKFVMVTPPKPFDGIPYI